MKYKLTFPSFCIALLSMATICLPTQTILAQDEDAPKKDGPEMTIGTEAPDLDIEFWVSDNDGSFEHVTKFESGKVYIIEFWATWCRPCIAQMPHIAKIQKEYADQGVQVISISDEEVETVEEFLEREIRGDEEERTFGELTNSYCLTADPDKSVMKDYFVAAGQTGIPCAFIVGKTGLVEWIGHPGRIDKPLKQIVDDEWDREAALVALNKAKEAQAKALKERRLLIKAMQGIQRLMQDGQQEEAIDLLEKMIEDEDYAFAKDRFSMMRLQVMVMSGHEGTATALNQFTDKNRKNSQALNEVAWGIYERHEAKGDVPRDVLVAAKATAEAAVKAEPDSGAILDTLAHYMYIVDGDLDKAIEIQKKAVKFGGVQEAELRPFLEQLLKEKETGNKPKKKKSVTDF